MIDLNICVLPALYVILRKDHVVKSVRLQVLPFYESLGPVYADSCEQPCWIQPEIKVLFDMRVVGFVLSRVALRAKFERALTDICPCRIVWPDVTVTDEKPVEIHFEAPVGDATVTPAVTKRCESALLDLLNSIKIRTVEILQETWSRFKSGLDSSANQIAGDDVVIECDDQNYTVTLIGCGEHFNQVVERLLHEKSALEADFQRRNVTISETIMQTRLKIDLIKACGLLDESDNMQLKIEIQNDKIVATGLAEDVAQWKMNVFQVLACSSVQTIKVDDYVLKALQKKPFRNHILDVLKAKSVTGVAWECSSTGVTILVADDKQVWILSVLVI